MTTLNKPLHAQQTTPRKKIRFQGFVPVPLPSYSSALAESGRGDLTTPFNRLTITVLFQCVVPLLITTWYLTNSERIVVSYTSYFGSIDGMLLFVVLGALPILALLFRARIYNDEYSPLVKLLYTCLTWMLFALYGTPLFILVRILYNGVTLPTNNFNDVLRYSRGLKVTRRLSEDELNIVVDSMLINLNSRYPHYSYSINRERKKYCGSISSRRSGSERITAENQY